MLRGVPAELVRQRDDVTSIDAVPPSAHALPVLHRGQAVGRWSVVAWNPQRFVAPYAERFVAELVEHAKRAHPGRDLNRRAPPLARPK